MFQKEQVILLQKDYEKLQSELDSRRHKSVQVETSHLEVLLFWKDKFASLHKENQALAATNKQLENQLGKQAEDARFHTKVIH